MTKKKNSPLLSVIIPVYNEQNTIQELIKTVKKAAPQDKEIIIVDDCSQDKTAQILCQPALKRLAKIIRHDKNQGKGAAIKTGLALATGRIVIIQDADLEYHPEEYPRLLDPIISGKADVVFGSRFAGGGAHRVVYFWHYLGNRFLTFLSNAFSNLNLTDMETGSKAFRREILQQINLKEKRFGFEPEITAKVAKLKCSIYEVGINYYGRTYAEGKKIGWKDGVVAIWYILKYNLGHH